MKKQEFLDALSRGLSQLPRSEREEQVNFYREMIDDRIEEGVSEEEAVVGVGTVEGIVSQTLSERPAVAEPKPEKNGFGKVGLILLLTLGFPVWFPILLSVFVTVASLVLSFFVSVWAVEISLAAAAIGCVGGFFVLIVTGQVPTAFFALGAGLVAGGFAILLYFGAVAVTRTLWRGTKAVGRLIFGRLKRKEKENV